MLHRFIIIPSRLPCKRAMPVALCTLLLSQQLDVTETPLFNIITTIVAEGPASFAEHLRRCGSIALVCSTSDSSQKHHHHCSNASFWMHRRHCSNVEVIHNVAIFAAASCRHSEQRHSHSLGSLQQHRPANSELQISSL